MILTKCNDCPRDKYISPTSPVCSKCNQFVAKKLFNTGPENMWGVACKMATEEWELETYFSNKMTEPSKGE